jgi:hypothetical protein
MSNFYTIYATEKVVHEIRVMADSEEQARQMVLDGEGQWDQIDGENFSIFEVIFEEIANV